MKRIGLYSAVSAAVMLLAACGGGGSGGGQVATVDVPVGLWTASLQDEGLARQLYVLPAASGTSQAWAIESTVSGSGLSPRQLAFADLVAGPLNLTGSGNLRDLSNGTQTSESLTVIPNTNGQTLQFVADGQTWVLNRQALTSAGTDATLWTGSFRTEVAGDLPFIDWTFSLTGSTGTLQATDNADCSYAGTLTSVGNINLPHVVRVSFQGTSNSNSAQCGNWSGMGTVARDSNGDPAGRTLWLRKSSDGTLQRVSLLVLPPS